MNWVGVDIASRSFVAARRDGSELVRKGFSMTPSGWRAWLRWAGSKPKELRACLESTGPYWRPFAAWLEERGIRYALANPRKVRRFAQASEHRSKSDAIDAEIVLRFAETFQPALTLPQEPSYRQLRAVSRRILQLQGQLDIERDRAAKAAVDPATPASVLESFRAQQEALRAAIDGLEVEARHIVKAHSTMRQQWDLLISIPSVGPKTARTLIAEYSNLLGTANPRQMTRYAGLDIVLHESGTSVHKRPRISKQGNWRLRRALFLACLSGITCNPTLSSFYDRKVAAGIPKKKALVAAMRKLIHVCFGVLKNQTPFCIQPNMA